MDSSDFEEIMRIQRLMASRIVEEQRTENKLKLMSIISDMVLGRRKSVQKEAVIVEAEQQGLPESETLRLLEELKRDKFLEEKEGYLKLLD